MASVWKQATREMIREFRAHDRLPYTVGGYVYLVRRVGTDEYKIGMSADCDRRLSELQVSNGGKLEIVNIIATDWPDDLEETMHMHFRTQRLRGEWFRLTENDVHCIRQIRDGHSGDCNLDLVMSRYYGIDKP